MGKKLAIKGHTTRGKEVIEILEMLGGVAAASKGFRESYCYYVSENFDPKYISWDYIGPEEIDTYEIFTLEEFLEKFPFKVGEFVFAGNWSHAADIRKMRWNPNTKEVEYMVKPGTSELWYTANKLTRYSMPKFNTGETVYNKHTRKFGEIVKYQWQKDEYIYLVHHLMEDAWYLERQLTKDVKSVDNEVKSDEYADEMQTKRDMDETMFMLGHTLVPNKVDDNLEYNIINGYEFDRVENGKIILKPTKSKYPTNYQECCDVLGLPMQNVLGYIDRDCNKHDYYNDLQSTLNCFVSLKICRDAYWKIAGEQMGLDKPWEPDWNEETDKFTISNKCNKIYLNNTAWYAEVLSFPTAEMRDAFFENFKDLIELCKELL